MRATDDPSTESALVALFAEGTCPSVLSSTSAPVSDSFRTSRPRRELFLTFGPGTAFRPRSAVFTAPLRRSPLSTVFLPGSAIAVPDRAASSARNATAIAGLGMARSSATAGAMSSHARLSGAGLEPAALAGATQLAHRLDDLHTPMRLGDRLHERLVLRGVRDP